MIKAIIMKEMIIIVILIIGLCCSCSPVIIKCPEGTEAVI